MTGEGEPFPEKQIPGIAEPRESFGKSTDPLLSAFSILKKIFDSNNQTLIQAINTDLIAFEHMLNLQTQISTQTKEIDRLETQINANISRLNILEARMEHQVDSHPSRDHPVKKQNPG